MKQILRVLGVLGLTVLAILVFAQQEEGEDTTSTADPPQLESANQLDQIESGEQIYGVTCVSCHGVEGGGDFGPALSGNERLENAQFVILQIAHGGGGMPSFGPPQLAPEELANVASYIRSSWGNEFGEVDASQVEEVLQTQERAGMQPAGESEWPDGQGEGQQAEAAGQQMAPVNGESIYNQNCAQCHGQEGRGGVGPPLAGNTTLAETRAVVAQTLHGGGGMPAFSGQLSANEIAAVVSHIRTQFGNDFGEVTVETVRAVQESGQ